MKLSKMRATSSVWESAYPWHLGGSIPSLGPPIGINLLAGGAPFGFDPNALLRAGWCQNTNCIVVGDPGNGKSALVKMLIYWLVGAFGYRFVGTDPKGEYTAVCAALGTPILDIHPRGTTKINPLDDADGRLEFVSALAVLCLNRALTTGEEFALASTVAALPDKPVLSDLFGVLKAMPESVTSQLSMSHDDALTMTRDLRFGIGGLLSGALAGMFDERTNVHLAEARSGFAVNLAKCGTDDRVLRFAMLAGTRAAGQLIGSSTQQTIMCNDEGWRLGTHIDTVRSMQHSFKMGRTDAKMNLLIMHRLAELGGQTDGAAAAIANRLVSDSAIKIVFRQEDAGDAADTVTRLGLPAATEELLRKMPPRRCLIVCEGRYALVDTKLSPALRSITDTNMAMRAMPGMPGEQEIFAAARR